jgi:hypothetical protein
MIVPSALRSETIHAAPEARSDQSEALTWH